MSAEHHCHLPGCTTPTPRKWLYCKPHWFMVPAPIRRRVWAAYDALPHGPQGNCLRVSKEWIAAVHAAEDAIKSRRQNVEAKKKEGPALRQSGFELGAEEG